MQFEIVQFKDYKAGAIEIGDEMMAWASTGTERWMVLAVGAWLGSWIVLPPERADAADEGKFAVSPALKITPQKDRPAKDHRRAKPGTLRSIDGSGNNARDPAMGAALTPLLRLMPPDYADRVSEMAGSDRPGPREISQVVSAQTEHVDNPQGLSDFIWQWGQFLDHDLDLIDGVAPPEPAPIEVPVGDPSFDPEMTGTAEIPFNRSNYDKKSGKNRNKPREQLNEITAWIDASNVYGSDPARAAGLRTSDGTGRLRTSEGDLLPFNLAGLPNAGGNVPQLFLAGDVRANEQVGLTAMHTLFVREHNRLADLIAAADPGASGDEIYQEARRIVGAQMQAITYSEFLPALLGPDALEPYQGYDPAVDARLANVFAAAAYRFGHSALSPMLLRLDAQGMEIDAGHLRLRDAFFAPGRIIHEGGIDPLLRDAREALGLARAASFADVSSDPEIQTRLAAVYSHPDTIDLWIGGLAEDAWRDAQVGQLFFTIIKEQFEALRDGDRFWYELTPSDAELFELQQTRLSDIIRRNTEIEDEIPDDVFRVRGHLQFGRR
jgi:peroxidase